MAVYGPVRHQKYIIWTEAHMAVYGPVRHQKHIIWTEAPSSINENSEIFQNFIRFQNFQ